MLNNISCRRLRWTGPHCVGMVNAYGHFSLAKGSTMIRALVVCGAVALLTAPALGEDMPDPSALKTELIQLETQSWVAWKNHDGKFFEHFLSDDHVEIQPGGRAGKADVVAGVVSPICTVVQYAVSDFALTVFSPTTALLTYKADQNTTCGGTKVPTPVWASSLFVKRDGHWVNALYSHTAIR